MSFFTDEELEEIAIDKVRLDHLEALISILKEDSYSFEEIYKKVSAKSICDGFSEKDIKYIYEQV